MSALDDQKKTGLPLFMIRGIQLRLDYSWFIVFALVFVSLSAGYFPRAFPDQSAAVYWTAGFVATLLFFLSVVTHELAHSLMAIRSGIQVPEITLFLFGGMARISEEAGDPRTEFKIAVVGPLTSFALALVFWVIELALRGDQPTMVVEIFSYLAWINIALGVFNLLPGFPLDGGRILRAFWWWKTGSMVEATRVASDWGKGLAIVIMIMGGLQIFAGGLVGGLWLIFIGMFLRGVAEVSYQELALKKSLEGTRAADLMVRDVITAPPDLPVKGLISDYFLRYGYRGFPVTTDGRTLGVISISNVRDVPENEQATRTVGQLMAPLEPHMIISPETSANEILTHMSQNNLGRVLVMRDDHMLGMVTRTGLLRFMEMKRILGRPEMQQAR